MAVNLSIGQLEKDIPGIQQAQCIKNALTA